MKPLHTAYFSGTGPFESTCGQCRFRGYFRQFRDREGNLIKTKWTNACAKYHDMTGLHGNPLPRKLESCRYYEAKGTASLSGAEQNGGNVTAPIIGASPMDMGEHVSPTFLRLENIKGEPQQRQRLTIDDTILGTYGPTLKFKEGVCWTTNNTARTALIRAYGRDTNNYRGMVVELYAGFVKLKGKDTEAVLLRPITQRSEAAPTNGGSEPPDDMNSEIPF